MTVDERLGSLVPGAEMATLNMGTLNFGDDVFVNSRPDIVRIAARIRERRLVPECEVYDAGMLETLRWLLDKGHLGTRTTCSSCSASREACRAASATSASWWRECPSRPSGRWRGSGGTRCPWPQLPPDGRTRPGGLEDNLYLSKGVLAKGNGELVAEAVRLVRASGRGARATSDARRILGLP